MKEEHALNEVVITVFVFSEAQSRFLVARNPSARGRGRPTMI
jgi:hypothetical protein